MRSIVSHKVGIDEQNPELGRALEHAGVGDCKRAAARSPGSSVGSENLQPAKRNVALYKDRLDVILEAFLLSTNNPTA